MDLKRPASELSNLSEPARCQRAGFVFFAPKFRQHFETKLNMAGSPNRGVLPNVNAPDAKVPTEQELGFHRMGPGQGVSALLDPIGGMVAFASGLAAQEAMRKRYPDATVPGSNRNNEADAYRHATWNYLMSKTIGPERAKIMADAHEFDGVDPSPLGERLGFSKNNQGERLMDLHNNEVGRHLPTLGEEAIIDALRRDLIRKRPY